MLLCSSVYVVLHRPTRIREGANCVQQMRPIACARYACNGPREGACTLFFCMYCVAGLCAHALLTYNLRTEILSTPYIDYWDQSICLILFFIVAFRQTGILSRHLECSDVFSPRKASESFCVSKTFGNGNAALHRQDFPLRENR